MADAAAVLEMASGIQMSLQVPKQTPLHERDGGAELMRVDY